LELLRENGIREKINALKQTVCDVAKRANRADEGLDFILVTKTITVDDILEAYEAGVRNFGENKVQEFLEKEKVLPLDISWHFVGRLQTNKVKYLFGDYVRRHGKPPLIHSLDRLELVNEIEKQAAKFGISKVPCLVQINSAGELSKAGFSPDQVSGFVPGAIHV